LKASFVVFVKLYRMTSAHLNGQGASNERLNKVNT